MSETDIPHKSRCARYKERDIYVIFARFRLCLRNPFSKTQNKKNNNNNNSNNNNGGSSRKYRLIGTKQTGMTEEEATHVTAARRSGDPTMSHMFLFVPVV